MTTLAIGRNKIVTPANKTMSGFTLVEIMLSISILSIGLVLILQGFAHCLNVLKISEDNLKASLIAENRLAEAFILAKEDWDKFDSGSVEHFKYEGLECRWEIETSPVEIVWESESEDFALDPEKQETLHEVKATLSWKEGRRSGTIPLVTYMREPVKEDITSP